MALAGGKALQVYSLDEAERRFRRVLELSETNPGCADEFLVTDVVTKLARLFYYRGEINNIIALVEPYLSRVAALGDKLKESRCLFEVGYACMFSARGEHGKALLEKALAIGEELEDAEAIAYAGVGLLYFYGLWGGASQENDRAVAALRERVDALSRTLPDVWVRSKFLNSLWSDAISHGRFTEGHELCLKLFELSRSSGDPRPMGFGYWQTALNDLTRDQPAEALKNARQSMQVALAPVDHLFARVGEGGALALLGRAEEAVTVLADVVEKSQARGLMLLIMVAGPFYGASMALAGQLGRGIRCIHASIKQTEGWGNPYWPVVGYVLLGEIYLQIATAPERPPFSVIIRNLLFVLTNVPIAARKAGRYFEEAIHRSRSLNSPGNLARALFGLGMLNAARKQIERARTYLTEAAEVAEAVRDENIATKARKALAAL
jgi:tetratricopeptide (TPR) repeat protein